jgi:5,10-methenyltetrahydromethanopterin hydrogenase
VSGLLRSAKQAGHQVEPEIAFQGGVELLEALAQLADASNIHDYSEKELENSLYAAMDIFLKNNPDMVDQPEAQQEFAAVVQADKNGTLEQILPQIRGRLEEAARAGPQQDQQQPAAQQMQPQQQGGY